MKKQVVLFLTIVRRIAG